jgi:hypothetical protein
VPWIAAGSAYGLGRYRFWGDWPGTEP